MNCSKQESKMKLNGFTHVMFNNRIAKITAFDGSGIMLSFIDNGEQWAPNWKEVDNLGITPCVTREEIMDYIMDQPVVRKITWGQNHFTHPCGCVMVHYGWDKGFPFLDALWHMWTTPNGKGVELEGDADEFFRERCSTYGALQEELK